MPATLSLTLGAAGDVRRVHPGRREGLRRRRLTANVISTAGDATLSVADPSAVATGHLVNGTFSLPQPLQAGPQRRRRQQPYVGASAAPTTLLTYAGPVTNDAVTLGFKQPIGATDALRTGTTARR